MGKISKAEIKIQKEVQVKLQSLNSTERPLYQKVEDINYIYENYNPAMDGNITEGGIYFTPDGLCRDFALMSPKSGHIVDVCSGIGGLTANLIQNDYYHSGIESITLIEYSPLFSEMSKRLICHLSAFTEDRRIIQLNFIQGDAYDKETWDKALSYLPLSADGKFNVMCSNPPYGSMPAVYKEKYKDHLKYFGERELMAVELCLLYSRYGMFILPPMSSEVVCSGREYKRQESKKVNRLRKALGEDVFFFMEAEGIDCSIYIDDWKGTRINTEVVSINLNRSEYL